MGIASNCLARSRSISRSMNEKILAMEQMDAILKASQ